VLERQQADGLRARLKAGLIEHRTVELLRPYELAGPILSRGGRVGTIEFRADGQACDSSRGAVCGAVLAAREMSTRRGKGRRRGVVRGW
jgi:hypothetical protein